MKTTTTTTTTKIVKINWRIEFIMPSCQFCNKVLKCLDGRHLNKCKQKIENNKNNNAKSNNKTKLKSRISKCDIDLVNIFNFSDDLLFILIASILCRFKINFMFNSKSLLVFFLTIFFLHAIYNRIFSLTQLQRHSKQLSW